MLTSPRVPSVTVFVLGHTDEWLSQTPWEPPYRRVDLRDIAVPAGVPSQTWLSEMVAFFDGRLLNTESTTIWICSARHDDKHGSRIRTRLTDLHKYTVKQWTEGWCVRLAEPNWDGGTEDAHPGMSRLISEARDVLGLKHRWRTCYANTFCLHRDMMHVFLDAWRKGFSHFHGKYGHRLQFDPGLGLPERKGSYFYERMGMAILADMQIDLREVP